MAVAPPDDTTPHDATAVVTGADELPVMPSIVTAHQVTRIYGSGETTVTALDLVTVGFGAKSFTAVMGPSGSGKSTLMHVLAGLDKPTSGSVTVDGQVLTRMRDRELTLLRRRKIGFVFQFFNLLPMLTAEENILLPLRIAGTAVDRDRFKTVVTAMGIDNRLKHRPAELSGGQQQRVAIARALVPNPAVIFADEPTGNLDSAAANEVLDLMRLAVEQLGQTIIMVTHEAFAAAATDRVVFLADGKVVRDEDSVGIDAILGILRELG
jgi:putative ABC transport system ATP-binding protein